MFRFFCATCGLYHEGMPSFATEAPPHYYAVSQKERDSRCILTSDTCVIDGEVFFVRGCLEIPVIGAAEPFVWGVWVTLSHASFNEFLAHYDTPQRSHLGPYFGWLPMSQLAAYPDTSGQNANLKTHVHLRDNGIRPRIELEHTDHLISVEQRNGITEARLVEIYAMHMH